MQDQSEALVWRQGLENDEQCRPDGVGEQRLLLWVVGARVGDFGTDVVERLLPPGASRPQYVQADPCDHRGEPAAEIVYVARGADVAAVHAQPRLLDRILGVAAR